MLESLIARGLAPNRSRLFIIEARRRPRSNA
jgi:hypothetical protein